MTRKETRRETRREIINTDAIVAAATAATTAAIAKDMVKIVNTAVAEAIKEHIPAVQVAVAEPVPAQSSTASCVAEEAVPTVVTADAVKPASTRVASDKSIVSFAAMGVSIVGSAGYDLLFGDPNKSNLDIAIKAISNGFIGSAAGYGLAHFLSPEDNSTLSIAAMGLTAGSLVVGVDKFVDHLFELRDAASEESVLENLIK